MLADCGLNAAMTEIFYKNPDSIMESGLFPINCDNHVLELSNVVDGYRVMYLHYETIQET